MAQLPPRKRFLLHLSTAIVMMFVAGALIWLNVLKWRPQTRPPRCLFHGWPLFVVDEYLREVNYVAAATNVIIAIVVLIAIWQLCEWVIYYGRRESARRRAARKGA